MSLTFNFLLEISRTIRPIRPIASDTLYNHLFEIKKKTDFQILVNSDQMHIPISSLHSVIPPRLAICIRPPLFLYFEIQTQNRNFLPREPPMILDEGSRENVCVAMKAFFEVRS